MLFSVLFVVSSFRFLVLDGVSFRFLDVKSLSGGPKRSKFRPGYQVWTPVVIVCVAAATHFLYHRLSTEDGLWATIWLGYRRSYRV